MLAALEKGVKGGKWFLCRAWVVLYDRSLCDGLSVLSEVNHRLESRVRENRTHGSEGGGTGNTTGSSYPYNGFEAFRFAVLFWIPVVTGMTRGMEMCNV